jgi:hypothetical protein
LTLLKNKKTSYLILISFGIFLFGIFLIIPGDSCGLRHISIVNDLKTYEKSLDPEFCEVLVEKIDSFNLECSPYVEILDCG